MTSTKPPSLIAPYMKALQELDRGVRAPGTAAQMHLVEVCRGAARPVTTYERAYMGWRAKEQQRLKLELEAQASQKELRTSGGNQAAITRSSLVPGRSSDPKPYGRFVPEPLGSREDFERDRDRKSVV